MGSTKKPTAFPAIYMAMIKKAAEKKDKKWRKVI
jgi:hypothetical protein